MTPGRAVLCRRKDGSEFSVELALNPLETANGRFVVASIVDVSERRRFEAAQRAALDERLALEHLIAELSSAFINLPADLIDDAIRSGLGQACTLLGLDRGTFIRIGPGGVLRPPIGWTADQVEPLDDAIPIPEQFPWTLDQLLSGDVVCFATRDEIPDEIDRAQLRGDRDAVVHGAAALGRGPRHGDRQVQRGSCRENLVARA